ncbi:MAG: hypothetical protein V7708_05895 [Oceanicoccus sp.]
MHNSIAVSKNYPINPSVMHERYHFFGEMITGKLNRSSSATHWFFIQHDKTLRALTS